METTLETIDKQSLREMINEGREIKNLKIDRLTLSKFDLPYPLVLTECIIDDVSISNMHMKHPIIMRRCKIGQFVMTKTICEQQLDLKKSKISRLRITHSEVHGNLSLTEVKSGNTSLHSSVIHQTCKADRATFTGSLTLSQTEFHADLFLNNTSVELDCNCSHMKIQGSLNAESATFAQVFSLSEAEISGDCLFMSSSFGSQVSLWGTRFGGLLSFKNVLFGHTLDMRMIHVEEATRFCFLNATIHKLILDHQIVDGRLFNEHNGKYILASKEYGILRNQYSAGHEFAAEDWAYYHLKRTERLAKPTNTIVRWLSAKLEYLFLDLGCGYGIYPYRTLGVCFFLIAIFAMFYLFFVPYDPRALFGFPGAINHFLYAFDLSLLVFSGGYSDFPVYGLAKFVAMIEYLIGLIFMGLFVVAISRKIIR